MVIIGAGREPCATQPPENPLRWDAWVALPDELKGRCAGASNATLALQQILGLPPDPRPRAVYELSVPREKVLRPCISGSDPSAPTCLPEFPAAPLQGEEEATPQKFADLPPDKKNEIYTTLAASAWNGCGLRCAIPLVGGPATPIGGSS
jgi:hypothetical protein